MESGGLGLEILKEILVLGKENGMDTAMGKVSAFIGASVGFLFGGWHEMLTILAVVQGIDIISGFMKQLMFQSLSSREMFDGLLKKASVWFIIILANMVDLILFDNSVVLTGAAAAYIINESLSIVENFGEMGVFVPENVLKYLKQVREKYDEDVTEAVEVLEETNKEGEM